MAQAVRFPTIAQIAQEAGVEQKSFSKAWKGVRIDGFKRELAKYIADRERFSELPEVADKLLALSAAPNLYEALRDFSKEDFRLIRGSEANAGLLALLGGANDREIRKLLRLAYHEIDEFLVELLTEVLKARRMEPVPELTIEDLAIILNQLCDGLTTRARFDSEHTTADLYATAVVGILSGLTRRIGDSETLPERVQRAIE